ncbi:hypothetical protein [Humibacter ginsengisoli]
MSNLARGSERYRALNDWLLSCSQGELSIPLSEIEDMVGFQLPSRAWSDPTWWYSAPRNTWARSWLLADRAASLDVAESRVTFKPERYSPVLDHARADDQRKRTIGWAREQLSEDSSLWAEHVKLGWWEPHTVYVLHKNNEPIYKVGITNSRTDRRTREQTAKGRASLVETTEVPNKWAAVLVEGRVLELTEQARRHADPFTYFNGQTEHWDDSLVPPELSPIVAELAADGSLRYWSSSLDRNHPRVLPNPITELGNY